MVLTEALLRQRSPDPPREIMIPKDGPTAWTLSCFTVRKTANCLIMLKRIIW